MVTLEFDGGVNLTVTADHCLLASSGDKNQGSFFWSAAAGEIEKGNRVHAENEWMTVCGRSIVTRSCEVFEVELQNPAKTFLVSTQHGALPRTFFTCFGARQPPRPVLGFLILLRFSRSPQALEDVLLDCEELAEYRENLRKVGRSPKLPEGAKLFVKPSMFQEADACVKAYVQEKRKENHEWDLKPCMIFCGEEIEQAIKEVVKDRLPTRWGQKGAHVSVKHRDVIGVCRGAPFIATESGTLLEVRSRNTRRSPTASTTDAHLGPGGNPRRRSAAQTNDGLPSDVVDRAG